MNSTALFFKACIKTLLYLRCGIYIRNGAIPRNHAFVRNNIANANPRNNAPRATLKLLIIWHQAYRGLPFTVLSFPMALYMH